MRRSVLITLAITLLAGCSATGTSVVRSVPGDCEIESVIAAFDEQVAGSDYVPTDWQPSEGTDLKAAIDAGGIACSYGIQVAEVGGTILWAPASDELWESRSDQWKEYGQTPIDLEGFDEDAAFILQDGTSADEMHVWTINLLVDGIWIQVGATFLQTVEEASGIIEAAIEATRT